MQAYSNHPGKNKKQDPEDEDDAYVKGVIEKGGSSIAEACSINCGGLVVFAKTPLYNKARLGHEPTNKCGEDSSLTLSMSTQ